MAPRNTANLDCNRYSLRAWKQQASFEKIVPENVTTKADFLNLFGLTLCNNNIRTSINCQNRAESGCKCSDNNSDNKMSEIMDNTDKDSTTLRPCWVVVPNEQCTSCKRIFKCKSDLTNHVQKKHKSNKVKKRVRMVLRIGQEIVREKYVKKKHLAPSCSIQRSPSDYIDPLVKEGFNCNRISTPIVDDTPTLSPSSSSSLLNSDESANDDRLSDSLESQNSNDSSNHRLSPTAPSIGTEMELPVCHVESNCFVKNIISKTQNDLEDMQDQNNNSFCNKNNDNNNNNNNNSNNNNNNEEDLSILSNTNDKKTHETLEINETIENEDHDSESEDIECCSRSVSVQTPSCWEYRTLTLLEYSRALEADKRRQKEEEEEEDKRAAASANAAAALAARVNDEADVITIDDDIDNSIERKFNETNDLPLDYPMKETTEDSEIEEIIEITRQQPEKPLLISDAIQALIATESTMQHLETLKKYKNNDLLIKNFEDVDFEDNDDVLSCATLHLHSDENHHFDDFDTFDIAHFQKNIVDDDVSLHLIDSEEKNYTFNIKDDFDYEEFQMYTMKQMAKAKSLHEEFDSETKSWKKPNHDRLSITSAPISFLSNHQNPSIIIKEELTIDDYSFSTE